MSPATVSQPRPPRYREPHLAPAGDEHHQRHHGERQLHGEHHLAEDQELTASPLSPARPSPPPPARWRSPRVTRRRSPGRDAQVEKPFHHDLPRQGSRSWSSSGREHNSAIANSVDASAEPSNGESNGMGLLDFGDVGLAARWKVAAATIRIEALMNSARHQRDGGIDGRKLDRLALPSSVLLRSRASARSTNADRDYAASPSPR